jgi:uncharacterized protein involved in cysteine biosynthesis
MIFKIFLIAIAIGWGALAVFGYNLVYERGFSSFSEAGFWYYVGIPLLITVLAICAFVLSVMIESIKTARVSSVVGALLFFPYLLFHTGGI